MLDALLACAAFLLIVALGWPLWRKLLGQRETIHEFERGLLYRSGRFERLLGPGSYRINPQRDLVTRVDMRVQTIILQGQEVLTADNVGLKISLAGTFNVTDPERALTHAVSYHEVLYQLLQMELRDLIGGTEVDALLVQRQAIGAALLERAAPMVAELGLALLTVGVKDMMFPGELKQIFAQVVNARKEGQAALERARGETAALRNLANSARLLEKNPALLQLRLLQAISSGSNNTIVLTMPSDERASRPAPLEADELPPDERLPPA